MVRNIVLMLTTLRWERKVQMFFTEATTRMRSGNFIALDEDGNYYVHNEGNVEIISGKKANGELQLILLLKKEALQSHTG